MRNTFKISALALAVGIAAPAFAQEEADPFDGIYIGGSFGYSAQPNDNARSSVLFDNNFDGRFGDSVVATNGQNAFGVNTTGGANNGGFCGGRATGNNISQGCQKDRDDIEYFGRIGFDRHSGNVVVGLVGEFGRSDARDSVTAFSTTPASYTLTRRAEYQANLRARIGFTPGPARTTLFYATGGGSYAKIKNSFTTTNGLNSFTTRGKTDGYGFQAGGGVEQKLGRNFSIGLEYLYNDIYDDDGRTRVGAGTAPATSPFLQAGAGTDFRRSDPHFRWHSMRVTAAFRF